MQKEYKQGLLARIGIRVADNFQVNITNIKLSIENNESGKTLRMGLGVKNVTLDTCKSNWERGYIDRTVEENKLLPLLKIIGIGGLSLYISNKELIKESDYIISDCNNVE
jgi:hypothetical protein